jgi:hypothetical protein
MYLCARGIDFFFVVLDFGLFRQWYFLFFILLETFVVRKYDMPQKWKHINIGLLIPVVSQKKTVC